MDEETPDNVLDMDIGSRLLDSRGTTPEHILRLALEDIRQGKRAEQKMVVLFLDDSPGHFGIEYYQSGMRLDQCAMLCDLGNSLFKRKLGI